MTAKLTRYWSVTAAEILDLTNSTNIDQRRVPCRSRQPGQSLYGELILAMYQDDCMAFMPTIHPEQDTQRRRDPRLHGPVQYRLQRTYWRGHGGSLANRGATPRQCRKGDGKSSAATARPAGSRLRYRHGNKVHRAIGVVALAFNGGVSFAAGRCGLFLNPFDASVAVQPHGGSLAGGSSPFPVSPGSTPAGAGAGNSADCGRRQLMIA